MVKVGLVFDGDCMKSGEHPCNRRGGDHGFDCVL